MPIAVYPTPPVSISVNGDTLTAYNSNSYQWFFNGSEITDANAGTYIAQQTGAYTVQVTDTNGCTAVSNAVNVIVTGIESLTNNSFVSIYPNPASANLLLVEVSSALLDKPAAIFDVQGRLLNTLILYQPKTAIDITKFAAGVYFIRVNGNTRKWVRQ